MKRSIIHAVLFTALVSVALVACNETKRRLDPNKASGKKGEEPGKSTPGGPAAPSDPIKGADGKTVAGTLGFKPIAEAPEAIKAAGSALIAIVVPEPNEASDAIALSEYLKDGNSTPETTQQAIDKLNGKASEPPPPAPTPALPAPETAPKPETKEEEPKESGEEAPPKTDSTKPKDEAPGGSKPGEEGKKCTAPWPNSNGCTPAPGMYQAEDTSTPEDAKKQREKLVVLAQARRCLTLEITSAKDCKVNKKSRIYSGFVLGDQLITTVSALSAIKFGIGAIDRELTNRNKNDNLERLKSQTIELPWMINQNKSLQLQTGLLSLKLSAVEDKVFEDLSKASSEQEKLTGPSTSVQSSYVKFSVSNYSGKKLSLASEKCESLKKDTKVFLVGRASETTKDRADKANVTLGETFSSSGTVFVPEAAALQKYTGVSGAKPEDIANGKLKVLPHTADTALGFEAAPVLNEKGEVLGFQGKVNAKNASIAACLVP